MAATAVITGCEMKRKLYELLALMDQGVPIIWETLEDRGLFGLFEQLPTRPEEITAVIEEKCRP